MTHIFGEVADVYDAVRPGYPAQIAEAIRDHHQAHNGSPPEGVVEIGAGTGKGTDVLLGLGVPVTCVEPDPRMGAVLRGRFPDVEVVTTRFEEWAAPGPVPVIACALAWHWLDPTTRNQRVHAALGDGGTLAVFGHRYGYADPVQQAAIDGAFQAFEPARGGRPDDGFADDIAGSGLFVDVRTSAVSREVPLSTADYLDLVRTFSPFRRHPVGVRQALLAALREAVGDGVVLDLRTTLVLATKNGQDAAHGTGEA